MNLVQLGDVCRFQNGRAFKKSEWAEKGLPIIRIQNLNKASAPFNYFSGEYDRRIEVSDGDLLFSWSGTVGSSFGPHIWSRGKGLLNQHIFRVSLDESVDKKYAYYALLAITGEIEKNVSGAVGLVHVTQSRLKEFRIPLPPLPEQKRIVAILDEAFAGIATAVANTEKNLANARELFEATVVARIFGDPDQKSWISTSVEALAAERKGAIRTGPFGSQLLHEEFRDAGVAVLGIDNAVRNEFTWGKRRFITEKKYQQLKRYTVKPGDVIITIMGTCGRCAVVPDDIPLAINTKHLCCITLDRTKCLPEFLHGYFLYHPVARKYLEDQAKGSIMAGLNMGIVKYLPVRLPHLEEQAAIVRTIDELKAQVSAIASNSERKLNALGELKQSLLQKAFSGELTAVPQDEIEDALA